MSCLNSNSKIWQGESSIYIRFITNRGQTISTKEKHVCAYTIVGLNSSLEHLLEIYHKLLSKLHEYLFNSPNIMEYSINSIIIS